MSKLLKINYETKKLIFGTLCMLMLGVSFTSCSDDDDDSKKKR